MALSAYQRLSTNNSYEHATRTAAIGRLGLSHMHVLLQYPRPLHSLILHATALSSETCRNCAQPQIYEVIVAA
jgi:hypothetical protein